MSAIAGVFYRDDRKVAQSELDDMAGSMVHRGPDGIASDTDGPVGMVHFMLHDTPESMFENLPNWSSCNRYLITFHGRIDNREKLHKTVNLSKSLSQTTDSDLILKAYKKWGKACVQFLDGDFAFAIWDSVEQLLFCARDRFGVKPFYYHESKEKFCFATEIKGLRKTHGEFSEVNNQRIFDFITVGVIDNTSTFYKNIYRLEPSHYLVVSKDKVVCCRYWELKQIEFINKSERYLLESFLSIYSQVISNRSRTIFPVGSFLSGGIDSSSIVCTLAQNSKFKKSNLRTYSGIFNKLKECDERVYFHHVYKKYPAIIPTELEADSLDPSVAEVAINASEDEPFFAPHFFLHWNLLKRAQKDGVRIIFDGFGGDSIISHGIGGLNDYALRFKYLALLREAYHVMDKNYIKSLRYFFKIVRESVKRRLLGKSSNFVLFSGIEEAVSMLDESLASRENHDRLISFCMSTDRASSNEQEFHKINIENPVISWVSEFLDRQAALRKMVISLPYLDSGIAKFCYSLPVNMKFRNGLDRYILRTSLAEFVPSQITNRRGKTVFIPSMHLAYSQNARGWLENEIDIIHKTVYSIIDEIKLKECVNTYFDNVEKPYLSHILLIVKIIALSLWLKRLDHSY